MEIEKVLSDREKTHGEFYNVAMTDCGFRDVLLLAKNNSNLNDTTRLAVNMILHKLSRILNGNPSFEDHWLDIIGYAQLEINEIRK